MTDRQKQADAEAWRSLRPGEGVVVTKPISETEKELLGRRFLLERFTKPHGYAVIIDVHGSWHVHPECLEKRQS